MTHVWLHSLEPGFDSHLSALGVQLADGFGRSNQSVSNWIPFTCERKYRNDQQSILLLVGDWNNFSRTDYFVAANALALHESGVAQLLPVILTIPAVTSNDHDEWLKRYRIIWERLHELAIMLPDPNGFESCIGELATKVKTLHLAHTSHEREVRKQPATLFFSYCHRDQQLRDELAHHLKLLERVGLIEGWHDREISAGEEWSAAIDAHLYTADLILLLLSSDFFASDYCSEIEVPIALERHKAHGARTIPILLRPVMWRQSPLAALQALPTDARPVTSWELTDSAFVNICEGIVSSLLASKVDSPYSRGEPPPSFLNRRRVMDAALPAEVEIDQSAMLVVLVHKPKSPGLADLLFKDPTYGIAPEDVHSKPVTLRFPIGAKHRPENIGVRVTVSAPNFDPPEQTRSLTLRPDEDSQPIIFMFSAKRRGVLKALVGLYNANELVASCALSTVVDAGTKGIPAYRPQKLDSTTFDIGVAAPESTHTPEEQAYLDTLRETMLQEALTRAEELVKRKQFDAARPILLDLQGRDPRNGKIGRLLWEVSPESHRRFTKPDPCVSEEEIVTDEASPEAPLAAGSFTEMFKALDTPKLPPPCASTKLPSPSPSAPPAQSGKDAGGGGLTQLMRTLDSPPSTHGATTGLTMPDFPPQPAAAESAQVGPGEFTRILSASVLREPAVGEVPGKVTAFPASPAPNTASASDPEGLTRGNAPPRVSTARQGKAQSASAAPRVSTASQEKAQSASAAPNESRASESKARMVPNGTPKDSMAHLNAPTNSAFEAPPVFRAPEKASFPISVIFIAVLVVSVFAGILLWVL